MAASPSSSTARRREIRQATKKHAGALARAAGRAQYLLSASTTCTTTPGSAPAAPAAAGAAGSCSSSRRTRPAHTNVSPAAGGRSTRAVASRRFPSRTVVPGGNRSTTPVPARLCTCQRSAAVSRAHARSFFWRCTGRLAPVACALHGSCLARRTEQGIRPFRLPFII